ncbi:MAG: ABC transporter ATP-binding protein [Alphaproteobacteria bacterium]|nr:ABC transporter ATP-binding protein [Alphaproteobacteria bacterium]
MASPPLFHTERLGHRFASGTEALLDVRLGVDRGEFLALLGPSGCGKSTLLRLLAGLDRPSAGAVHWDGGAPPRPGEIGFVFQEPTLMPWATVADNVWLPLRLRGLSRAEAGPRVAAVLEQVGLEGFADAYPRQLSGGMKMRVSIARALVTRPRVLLLDEPFAALDELTRFRLNDDLLSLWRAEGMTILFVTHSVFEAVFLAQRVAIMSPRPGRIAASLPIALPEPRAGRLRTTAEFGAACATVSDALAATMAEDGAVAP